MLTVTSKVELNTMRKQKSQLEFEQILISNNIKMYTEFMDAMQVQTGLKDSDLKSADFPEYQQYAALEDAAEERQEMIKNELALLKEDIDSFQQYHQQGIKNDMSFWCFGG